MRDKKSIVIVGPTGSGKTGVSIEIAEALGGEGGSCVGGSGTGNGAEIISADSRAIYRGMDIGTAKPTAEERERARHWGIDLVEPDERFTVADFKAYAKAAIADIRARGKVPFLVGGSGLYVDAVVYDYSFGDVVKKTYSDRKEMSSEFVVVGIKWGREELRQRITERANKLFVQNIDGGEDIYTETRRLAERYGWELQAMRSNIYPIVWRMMKGEIDLEEAKRLFIKDDMYLAKRQMTWFRRNKNIVWLPLWEVAEYVRRAVGGGEG
jgi:tRNA dimethylallyltransferase